MRLIDTRHCPKCRHRALNPTHYKGVKIDVCTHCQGLFFDSGELQRVFKVSAPDKQFESGEVSGSQTPHKCPNCRAHLKTHVFHENIDLSLELCHKCNGMWVDHTEIEQLGVIDQHLSLENSVSKKFGFRTWLFAFLSQLPIEYNGKPSNPPYITWTLIALCVLVFILQFISVSTEHALFVRSFAFIPSSFPSAFSFITLITSQFMHVGLGHLLGNLYFLYILGDNLEDAFGPSKYLLFYLACGVASSIAFMLAKGIHSETAVVGASGGISGLIAAYMLIFRHAKLGFVFFLYPFKVSAWIYFSFWFALQFIGFFYSPGGVAWSAHIGGFLFGGAVSLFYYRKIVSQHPLLKLISKGR